MDWPWQDGVPITEYTDRDIEERRSRQSAVADSSFELHRLVESIREGQSFDTRNLATDYVLRVELARMIDFYEVDFAHKDYDIAYMIPPVGWYDEYAPSEIPLVDEVDAEERAINYSTTPTVWAMVQAALDESEVDTVTELVERGARRLVVT